VSVSIALEFPNPSISLLNLAAWELTALKATIGVSTAATLPWIAHLLIKTLWEGVINQPTSLLHSWQGAVEVIRLSCPRKTRQIAGSTPVSDATASDCSITSTELVNASNAKHISVPDAWEPISLVSETSLSLKAVWLGTLLKAQLSSRVYASARDHSRRSIAAEPSALRS
jgi:hypothetical protein